LSFISFKISPKPHKISNKSSQAENVVNDLLALLWISTHWS